MADPTPRSHMPEALEQLQQAQAKIEQLTREREAAREQAERWIVDLEHAQAKIEQLSGELEIIRKLKDQAEMYLVDNRRRAEQAQAREKRLYNVVTAVRTGLAGSHRELGAGCGETACTLCWLLGEAEETLAAIAGGAADGELKPEVERRLQESLETPREKLLTSDEMRQKMEDADADPD